MQQFLAYQIWLSLPPEVRYKLSVLFNVPKTGSTIVEYRAAGNVVTSDGYTPIDLQTISLARLQEVLGSQSTNFYELFEKVAHNIDALLAGNFSEPEGSHISHPAQVGEKRVSSWTTFVAEHRRKGLSLKDISKLYKERPQ